MVWGRQSVQLRPVVQLELLQVRSNSGWGQASSNYNFIQFLPPSTFASCPSEVGIN